MIPTTFGKVVLLGHSNEQCPGNQRWLKVVVNLVRRRGPSLPTASQVTATHLIWFLFEAVMTPRACEKCSKNTVFRALHRGKPEMGGWRKEKTGKIGLHQVATYRFDCCSMKQIMASSILEIASGLWFPSNFHFLSLANASGERTSEVETPPTPKRWLNLSWWSCKTPFVHGHISA